MSLYDSIIKRNFERRIDKENKKIIKDNFISDAINSEILNIDNITINTKSKKGKQEYDLDGLDSLITRGYNEMHYFYDLGFSIDPQLIQCLENADIINDLKETQEDFYTQIGTEQYNQAIKNEEFRKQILESQNELRQLQIQHKNEISKIDLGAFWKSKLLGLNPQISSNMQSIENKKREIKKAKKKNKAENKTSKETIEELKKSFNKKIEKLKPNKIKKNLNAFFENYGLQKVGAKKFALIKIYIESGAGEEIKAALNNTTNPPSNDTKNLLEKILKDVSENPNPSLKLNETNTLFTNYKSIDLENIKNAVNELNISKEFNPKVLITSQKEQINKYNNTIKLTSSQLQTELNNYYQQQSQKAPATPTIEEQINELTEEINSYNEQMSNLDPSNPSIIDLQELINTQVKKLNQLQFKKNFLDSKDQDPSR